MSKTEQVALTASQAVDAIRNGRLSAEVYVTTLLERAEQQSGLNSMIALNKAGALAAARKVDAARASGATLPPLAGLPIVVKDNINTSDMPTTGGTPALKDVRPTANAPTLQRLIDAGAIVLGKANMHELAFGTTSTNFTSFAGTVHNPYDVRRVPGGSSGGTGAAIAARIAPAGLGTDTGGSVRIPAALCGIAGLRPTVGNGGAQRRYDGTGVLPISRTRDTIGPMGRTVADVALLDAVVTGASIAKPVQLSGLRLGVPASFWKDTETQVATVMASARTRLQSAGVVFVDIDTVGLWELDAKVSFQVVLHEAGQDIPAYLVATGVKGVTLADIAAKVASPDVKGPMGAVLGDVTAAEYQAAITQYRPQMQALYARYFADNRLDAMMFPTTSVVAPVIDSRDGSSKISVNGGPLVETFATMIRNSDPGSTTGVPGITLPAGLTATGLPVGLSLDGPMGSDAKLLGIGLSMESLLGVLPPPTLPQLPA
ncbi:indoleacetamide hydrolase [Variovorax sp. J22R24]|uniref:indoleacetamide hydrolase n=1 Tax=Variovorax gracilis TaxID=3053502 RepID=UPI002578460D|nr:indoleacetamide hydrolase [Variovorax sp. J22R24]MDM0106600.1 indoleacetamide hydrolase [Variovorax sp. J22R24]